MKIKNSIRVWQKISKSIDSCITWKQLNMCRNMLYNAVDKHYIMFGSEYFKDLDHKIHLKESEIEDIEDTELLEKVNENIKDKKTTS